MAELNRGSKKTSLAYLVIAFAVTFILYLFIPATYLVVVACVPAIYWNTFSRRIKLLYYLLFAVIVIIIGLATYCIIIGYTQFSDMIHLLLSAYPSYTTTPWFLEFPPFILSVLPFVILGIVIIYGIGKYFWEYNKTDICLKVSKWVLPIAFIVQIIGIVSYSLQNTGLIDWLNSLYIPDIIIIYLPYIVVTFILWICFLRYIANAPDRESMYGKRNNQQADLKSLFREG